MRPGLLAVRREVVGVRLDDDRRFVRLVQPERDAVTLGVGDRLFLGVERQAHLAVHVAGAGPAHAMYFSIYEHLKDQLQESSSKPSYVGMFVI